MLKLLNISETKDKNSCNLRKYYKVGIELFMHGNTKCPQIYTFPQLLSMPERNCGIY